MSNRSSSSESDEELDAYSLLASIKQNLNNEDDDDSEEENSDEEEKQVTESEKKNESQSDIKHTEKPEKQEIEKVSPIKSTNNNTAVISAEAVEVKQATLSPTQKQEEQTSTQEQQQTKEQPSEKNEQKDKLILQQTTQNEAIESKSDTINRQVVVNDSENKTNEEDEDDDDDDDDEDGDKEGINLKAMLLSDDNIPDEPQPSQQDEEKTVQQTQQEEKSTDEKKAENNTQPNESEQGQNLTENNEQEQIISSSKSENSEAVQALTVVRNTAEKKEAPIDPLLASLQLISIKQNLLEDNEILGFKLDSTALEQTLESIKKRYDENMQKYFTNQKGIFDRIKETNRRCQYVSDRSNTSNKNFAKKKLGDKQKHQQELNKLQTDASKTKTFLIMMVHRLESIEQDIDRLTDTKLKAIAASKSSQQ